MELREPMDAVKFDIILSELNKLPITFISLYNRYLEPTNKGGFKDVNEYHLLCKKLSDEGYIEIAKDIFNTEYPIQILYKGTTFIKNGGYIAQKAKENNNLRNSKNLNIILGELNKNQGKKIPMFKFLKGKGLDNDIRDINEYKLLVDKLVQDNNITIHDGFGNEDYLQITFDGSVLMDNGGYDNLYLKNDTKATGSFLSDKGQSFNRLDNLSSDTSSHTSIHRKIVNLIGELNKLDHLHDYPQLQQICDRALIQLNKSPILKTQYYEKLNSVSIKFHNNKGNVIIGALRDAYQWKLIVDKIKNILVLVRDETEGLENELNVKSYIDLSRIEELKRIKSDQFDLTKLIRFCEELNIVSENNNAYSVAMLGRAIIDHVPPIFNKNTFNEVANNYSGRSFQKSMQHLNNSLRNIADGSLHQPVRNKETLKNATQVNFSTDLDVLLEEVVRILK